MLPPEMAGTTITGANQQTAWFDLTAFADSVCFILTGDFSSSVGIRYSNNPAQSKGTDYTTDASTYSTKAGPLEFPIGGRLAKFVAFFSGGSWTAGTCIVRFAKGKNANGQLVDVAPQEAGGTPGTG